MSKNIYQFDEKAINELSTIEIAYEILKQSKKTYFFKELANVIAEVKNLNEEKLFDHLPQLYTEINIDGRFIHLGQNEWGLKGWYPLEKTEALLVLKEIEEDEFDDLEFSDDDDILEGDKIFEEDEEDIKTIDDDEDEDLGYEIDDVIDDEDEDLDEDLEEDVILDEVDVDDDLDGDIDDLDDEDEKVEYYADELEEDYLDEDESDDKL